MNKDKICGIYCITNTINSKKYIGQSIDIKKRWAKHKSSAFNKNDLKKYNYPLYKAIRKYGLENFKFEILERFNQINHDELNNREIYWISKYSPEYNQNSGGGYCPPSYKIGKLSEAEVKEIQKVLINDIDNSVSHKELAIKYKVSKDTIQAINVGRAWHDPELLYPLRYSKFDANKPDEYYNPKSKICPICGGKKSAKATCCSKCSVKSRFASKITKEELANLIYTTPFTKIADMYGVSDNAIRKWCKKYDLPYKHSQIHPKSECLEKSSSVTSSRCISCYSKDNILIKSFTSSVKAGIWCFESGHAKTMSSGIRSHISEVANGKRKSAYGFIWKWQD